MQKIGCESCEIMGTDDVAQSYTQLCSHKLAIAALMQRVKQRRAASLLKSNGLHCTHALVAQTSQSATVPRRLVKEATVGVTKSTAVRWLPWSSSQTPLPSV